MEQERKFEPITIEPTPTYINRVEVEKQIINMANTYKLRMTPNEFKRIVDSYINEYMTNVKIHLLINTYNTIIHK